MVDWEAAGQKSNLKLLRSMFWIQVTLCVLSVGAVLLVFYRADAKTSVWDFAPGVGTLVLFTFMLPYTYKRWQQARLLPVDKYPVRASLEVQRRFRRLTYYMMFFTPIALALNLLPFTSEPWIWIKVAILGAGAIVLGVWATRFSLWQRDEFWREQGKDPKLPERPARPDAP
ncbi:hypothetical protein ACX801_11785 [Arthrobacter bambusae]|uniref:hypothetical protein n=1 Tax=Arthrobacter sp. NPDC058127 TaxID=3346351 RepID=UPI0036EF4AD9